MRTIAVTLLLAAAMLGGRPAHAQEAVALEPVRVRVETSLGPFVMELDAARAPLTVASFLRYLERGFYEDTVMHRVVPGFVVQGGGYGPDGTPRAVAAPVPNESGNGLSNLRGTVAMARTGDPHSATSQFYVNLADNPALDPQPSRWGYAVFGRVVEGMEVLERIGTVATRVHPQLGPDFPEQPVRILRAERLRP
jgi:cyclophilin family peptidyl-prolyl cis-trans isomerase